jgi:hypothetical protein
MCLFTCMCVYLSMSVFQSKYSLSGLEHSLSFSGSLNLFIDIWVCLGSLDVGPTRRKATQIQKKSQHTLMPKWNPKPRSKYTAVYVGFRSRRQYCGQQCVKSRTANIRKSMAPNRGYWYTTKNFHWFIHYFVAFTSYLSVSSFGEDF